jgi:hypothetical protein
MGQEQKVMSLSPTGSETSQPPKFAVVVELVRARARCVG